MKEYQASPHFRIVNTQFIEKLNWTEDDDAKYLLSVWQDGQLIATTRVEWLADRHDLTNYASGLAAPADHVEWPALATSRTAIRTDYRRIGLHSLLRYHIIEAALRTEVQHIYGYGAFTAAGLSILSGLGYEFAERPDQDPDLEAKRLWRLIWLDLHRQGQRALALLDVHVDALSQQYPWTGPRLNLLKRAG